MGRIIAEDEEFKSVDFAKEPLESGEYENCTFTNCNLANLDLAGYAFIDCIFENCDLSMANLDKTALKTVAFKGCKLMGLGFGNCAPFLLAFSFDNCLLNIASFYNLKIKGTRFKNCNLQEADFTQADITGVLFDNCDLNSAVFENTILEKADLRTAFNYSIDPELNHIKGAKFSAGGIAGLLDKYGIEIE